MFSITPIGTNGLYPTLNKPTSCYLVRAGGKTVLLDLGSGAFPKLFRYVAPEDIDVIVISHFHFDHCADLGVFGYYMQQLGKTATVYRPSDPAAFSLFFPRERFNSIPIKEGSVDLGGCGIEFIRANHPIETYAVRISAEGKTFAYTADSNVCPALEKVFFGSDLAIADSAFLYSDWSEKKPHLSARHCGEYAEKFKVRTLLSHLNPKADVSAILKEARSVSALCELIENDKTYTL